MPGQPIIDFGWSRDTSGYVLSPGKLPRKRPGQSEKEWLLRAEMSDIQAERIVGKGGKLQNTKPLQNFPGLYRIFAKITSAAGLLDFVKKFGPLTFAGLPGGKGDVVEELLESASKLANQLHNFDRSSKPFVLLPSANMKMRIVNEKIGPRLIFSPSTLLDALWLQWALELTGGGKILQCLHCGDLFRAGPGLGRRGDAMFCCDEHRVEFNSLKRSKG
jgi:hypothetical protein